MAHGGGTFGSYLSDLKRLDMVRDAGGEISLTASGMGALGQEPPRRPETTAALVAMWKAVLLPGEQRMLDALVRMHPKGLTRAALGEICNLAASGGTFGAYLSTLRKVGLVEESRGQLRAAAMLFTKGEK